MAKHYLLKSEYLVVFFSKHNCFEPNQFNERKIGKKNFWFFEPKFENFFYLAFRAEIWKTYFWLFSSQNLKRIIFIFRAEIWKECFFFEPKSEYKTHDFSNRNLTNFLIRRFEPKSENNTFDFCRAKNFNLNITRILYLSWKFEYLNVIANIKNFRKCCYLPRFYRWRSAAHPFADAVVEDASIVTTKI